MIRNGEASLDASAARLQRALDALEARWADVRSAAPAQVGTPDTAAEDALHAELRDARIRERALESAAAEASTVLGRSAERIRAALEDEEPEPPANDLSEESEEETRSDSLDHLSDDQTDLHPTPPREF